MHFGFLFYTGHVAIIGYTVLTGHTVGFGIMAVSVCCFALSKTDGRDTMIAAHGRNYAKRIYYLCQPMHAVILILASITIPEYFTFLMEYGSIFVFLICFIIAFAIGVAKYAIVMMKEEDNA